jgi:ABC-2 type transport system permease protein
MTQIKKYLYIYWIFVKNGLIHQMEYRINFIMFLIAELNFVILKVFYVVVLYKTDVNINGIPSEMMLIFGGTFLIISAIYTSVFMVNVNTLSHHISTGYLDTFMTKPVSLQFMLSCRQFDIGAFLPNFITGLIMLIIGIRRYDVAIDIQTAAGFIILIVSSIILAYSVFFGIQLISFWIVKSDAVTGVLEVMWDYNNMPMTIYSKAIQNVLIFGVPLFVISNFPSLFILGKLNPAYIVWALIAPVIFLTITRLVWKTAIRNYTSASS